MNTPSSSHSFTVYSNFHGVQERWTVSTIPQNPASYFAWNHILPFLAREMCRIKGN